MRTTILATLLPALLLACADAGTSPVFSTDFRPGGLSDVAPAPDGSATDEGGPREDVAVPGDPGPLDVVAQDPATVDNPPPPKDVGGQDAPAVDGTVGECEDGAIRGVACGVNGKGLKPQSCAGGRWVDGGPCNDPDACKEGEVRSKPCGLNGRGTLESKCTGGAWVDGGCRDPDACKDGASEVAACGKDGTGKQARTCAAGAWKDGPCVQPGRWRCQNGACTPAFGDPACGDGTCDWTRGESRTSCPADCDPGNVSGEGQDCESAMDCVPWAWPAPGPGYWECQGLFRGTCAVVETDVYCGTDGYDYCYLDPSAAESDASCPQDCGPGPLECQSDAECLFQAWPAP